MPSRRCHCLTIALLALLLGSCIKNDIPYPKIQASFTSISAEYQQSVNIDSLNRIVTFNLTERANIERVNILGYSLTPGARIVAPSDTLTVLNLTNDVTVTLALYQDYEWTLKGNQTINRYLVVNNQIGSSNIDVMGRRVIFDIPGNVDVTKIYVDSIKLGPEGSVMSPDLNHQVVDFSQGVSVDVTAYGETTTWHIYAQVTEVTVFTTAAYPGTQVAWVYGEAEAGKDNGFEYRESTSASWTKVPANWITIDGGSLMAVLRNLEPMTEYAVRAYSDDMYGNELTFTTQSIVQMPNSSFEDWSQNGKIWQPWLEGQEPYWDTGNRGATVLGSANVEPTSDTSTGTGLAALLKTEFKGIGSLGKLAAGSIFAGSYVRTDGTNGILSFGRTFEQKPTKLRGFWKYHTEPISDVTAGFEDYMGRPDTCIVWVALIDSEEPFEIRTNPNNRHLFNPDADEVIAYGFVESGSDIPSYTQFELTLNYKSTSRTPAYILCVASSSKYGDYFTGGRGSQLYIDDLELIYDY